jgi:hypothetical protein
MNASPSLGTIGATATGSGLANTQSSYGGAFGLGSLGTSLGNTAAPSTSTAAPESGKTTAAPESTVSNLVGGFLSGLTSNVNSVTNAVSSIFGGGNTKGSPAGDASGGFGGGIGPDPSTPDQFGGNDSGGGSSGTTSVVPVTTPSAPAESPIKYDVSKFIGDVGKTTYNTPASVYTSYPSGQGIGSIAAPQYTGSFYNPSFGKVPYQ